MSASLGLFSIDLEAKIANFISDWGRAAREAEKQMRAIEATVEQGFKKVEQAAEHSKEGILEAVNALTGLSPAQLGIAAIVGGLGELTKTAIETGDKLNKMSQKVAIGVDALSGMAYAAKLADVDMDSFGSGLEKFAKAASAAAGGSKEQSAAFKAIGVSVTDASGKIRPMEQLVGDVAEKFSGFEDDANKTALAIALFGKSGAQLIPFLNEGRESIAKMSAEAKALGVNYGDIAKPSEEFNDNLTRLRQAAVGLGIDIARELLPHLIEAEEKTLAFVKSMREDGTIQAFAGAVANVALNLDKLATVFATKWAVGAVAGVFESLASATEKSAERVSAALGLVSRSLSLITAAVAGWQFGTYLRENFVEAQLAGIALVDGLLSTWERIKEGGQIAWLTISKIVVESVAGIKLQIASMLGDLATVAQYSGHFDLAVQLNAVSTEFAKAAASSNDYSQRIADVKTSSDKAVAGIHSITSQMADDAIAAARAAAAHKESSKETEDHGEKAKRAAPNFTALAKAMGDDAAKAASKLNELLNKDGEIIAALQAKLNPAQKLYSEYAKGVAEANTAFQKEIDVSKLAADGAEKLGRAKDGLIAKVLTLQQVLKNETAEFLRQHDVVGQYLEKIADDQSLIGLDDRQKEITKAVNDLTRAWEKNTPELRAWLVSMGIVDPTSESGRAKIAQVTGALYDNKKAFELNQAVTREFASIWSQSFDRVLTTSGNIWKRLKAGFSDLIDSIISYFAKLAVINPIMNAIFGSSAGFSLLPTLANAFGGGGAGGVTALAQTGSQVAGLANAGTGAGGAAGASGTFDWTSGSSWIGYGKKLWDGFSTGLSTFWNGDTMVNNVVGANPQFYSMSNGGYGSALGQGLGIAGGIYAGYSRARNADGVFGKVGGAAAYGLGTYALGAGLASAAGGAGFAAGVGGAFAIPVVGWVALAAMLIDKFSGGNLFGTGWHANGETKSNLAFGNDGLSVANSYEEKKKKALFGGNVYRWQDAPITDEQKAFVEQFNAAMTKVRESAASALGTEVANVVTGAFQQRWNKDGKVTEEISTVLGKTYKESMDAFVKRVQAENVLAQINGARGDSQASQIAEQYRSDAETLSQAAQMLLQAQVDIKNGAALLGSDASLVDLNKVVSDLAQQNETLVQTYQRLQSETKAMQTLLDTTGVSISKTGAEFVRFADAAAQADGGADQLKALIEQFSQAFYSATEIAKAQVDALQKQAENALSGIGLDPHVSMADFRKAYEAALPTLTPDQLTQWLRAGVYLAQFNDAEKNYADTLKQNAINVEQILDQLNPDRANKYAGTWQATLDAINQQFDQAIEKLKSLGATADLLAEAEAGRQTAIDKAKKAADDSFDAIGKQLHDGMAQLGGAGTSSQLQQAVDAIAKAETDTIDQINAAGALAGKSAAEIAALVGLAHDYADAQIEATKAAYKKQIDDLLSANDAKIKPLSDYQAAIVQINKDFDDQRKQLVDLGATTEQLTRLDSQRGQTLAQQATALLQSMGILPTMSEFQQSIAKIEQQEKDAIDAANLLAQAQGRAGASAVDEARIKTWATQQIADALSKLQARTQDIISQLYGGTPGTLDEVNRQIADLERSTSGLGSAADSAASSIDSAAKAMSDQVRLQIGDLSPYNDNKKLDIAKQAFLQGNASADDVLGIARRLFASSNDYTKVFDWVMANQRAVTPPGSTAGSGGSGSGSSSQLSDLYKKRDELLAQQAAAQRKALATELIQNIADQAKAQHIDALALMDILHVDIKNVVKDLGIDIKNLDANGVLGLANVASTLHINMSDLLAKLGIGLGDMYKGLVELTQRMGIDLAKLDATSVQKLGDLAGVLGISMKDLLTGLHLDLGSVSGGIEQMVAKLGIDLSSISGTNVEALAKLAGDLHLSLGDVVGALHLNLADIGPGLRDLAKQQGIDLSNIDATNLQKLTDLANTLHLSMSDVAAALNIVIPGVSNAITATGGLIGTKITDAIIAHQLTSRDAVDHIDGLARSITDMRNEQIAALRSVDAGIARLPVAIRDDRSNDDVVAELRGVRLAAERTANASEVHLPSIDISTDYTERNTSQTAANTADTAVAVRSSFVPTDRSVRP
jgi:hypothetical protein